MTHYDHEALSRFGLDPSLVDDPDALAAHLTNCEDCRDYFAVVTELDAALRDDETWAQVDALLTPSQRRSRMMALRTAIDAKEEDAARRLGPLLRTPLHFRGADVAANRKLWTAGAVRVLCAEANKRHEERPLFSLDIAKAAFTIARKLEKNSGTSPRFCMALSLRERGNALRYLGRFGEALEALGYAEKLFDQTPASDPHDVAIVQLIRATVYMKSERLPEAIAHTRECLPVFRAYGDRLRELSALMIQGACLYLSGLNGDAVRVYEDVIACARAASDADILARGLSNAANSYTELSVLDTAERYYIEAIVLYEELGLVTEKARTTWALASVTVKRGDLATGARLLEAARLELHGLGMLSEHGLATLEWAEVSLALDQVEGVADACRGIVIRFESEGMMKSARLALAHVHQALAQGTATPAFLRHIRLYLEALPSRPNEPFVPLQ